MISSLAPGSRIIARDEEWLVRRVDLTPSGAHLLTVTGLSALVRDKEAKFIDQVEALDEPINSSFLRLVESRAHGLHSFPFAARLHGQAVRSSARCETDPVS